MVWRDIIAKASAYLAGRGVDAPETAAELLAARLLNTSRGSLAAAAGREAPEKHLEAMRRGMKRLVAGEPVQYVLGEWDFRRLTLSCDKRALIPRPETEELVTRVVRHLKSSSAPFPRLVVDAGTGTGAIVLSLASELEGDYAFLGTDVSEDALALAKENARRAGLENKVAFALMDGLDDFDEPGVVDVLVSNPPYVATAEIDALDPRVRDFEPRIALDGGPEGLDFYDRYLADAMNILKPGGAVFFEIGEKQGPALEKLLSGYGFSSVKIEKDFSGLDRYASGILAD